MVARYSYAEPKRSAGRRAEPASSGGSPSGWMLFFIGCACMFVLGVLVGRNTAPVNFDMENLDKKLNQLESSVLADAGGQPQTPEALEDIPFEFYDKLREDTAGAADEPGGPTPLKRPRFEKKTPSEIAVASAEIQQESRPAPDQPAAAAAEPETAAEQTPSETIAVAQPAPTPETAPAPETPAVSGPGYAIQVASLRDPEKAATVRDKFRSKGYPAYTQQAIVEGKGQWCRVRLGPYAQKAKAESDLSRLQKAGVDAILFLTD